MTLKLNDKWVWDSWYAHDGERWHVYFLQADKSIGDPDLRHWNVTQGHATSEDLKTWQQLGTTFAPAPSAAWDDYTTWTGSVVKDDDGLWHLFYTGTSRADDGLYQRLGHATSTDMHNWRRVGDGLCLDLTGSKASDYEATHQIGHWHDRAMRDPWVMRDPDSDGWLMFFTARAPDIGDANSAGAIGFATSDNLNDWTLQSPVFVGGYGQLEVPQVFQIERQWYCLFCTAAEHWSDDAIAPHNDRPLTGNHYLMGDSPRGPWRLPDAPFLDGALPAYRYAARIVDAENEPRIIGFKDGGVESFAGIILDPVAVTRSDSGLLSIADN